MKQKKIITAISRHLSYLVFINHDFESISIKRMESAALYNILGIPIIDTIFVGQKKCRNGRLKEGPIRHTNMKQVHFEVMVRSYLPESLYLKLCVENNSTHCLSYRDSYPIPETSSENNLVIKLIPSLNHSRVYPVLLEPRKLEVKNRKKNKKI